MEERQVTSQTNSPPQPPTLSVVCGHHQAQGLSAHPPSPPQIVPSSLGTVKIKGVHEMRAVISLFYENRNIHYTPTPSLEAAVRALAHSLWQ